MSERNAPFRAMEDRELVIAFKAGDPAAYDEMYRRYSARVRSVCRRMLTNQEDAQEAVQETFLKAYLALPEFNGNYRLGAWLGRIASNVCVDQLRARARGATVVPLFTDATALAVESSPEDVVVGEGPEVAQQMGEMQPLHARVLMLRGVDGLSHREIAGKLAMSPAQVKALLHRARRSFKRSWEGAKGWVLAPLIALRATGRQVRSASQTGSQLAGATATVGPIFAERVAASAMIVAVALSGLPGASLDAPADASKALGRSPRVHEWELTSPRATFRVEAKAPEKRSAEQPSTNKTVRTERELVPGLQKVLTKAQTTVTHPSDKPSEDEDDSGLVPIGPESAGKSAQKVIQEVEDLVPDPRP